MPVVFWKELQDHFSSLRFMILLALIMLPGVLAVYLSGQAIQAEVQSNPTEQVFLRLLTIESFFFSLATFLGFFGPLVGITLGFDSISGEYGRGTLSRVLSQPIYRDRPDQRQVPGRPDHPGDPLGVHRAGGDRPRHYPHRLSAQRRRALADALFRHHRHHVHGLLAGPGHAVVHAAQEDRDRGAGVHRHLALPGNLHRRAGRVRGGTDCPESPNGGGCDPAGNHRDRPGAHVAQPALHRIGAVAAEPGGAEPRADPAGNSSANWKVC